ncbi:hypothetical protein [Jeotgalicoccus halotolerans]|uniref:Uncharacterized protein n=1 Tax=Jeotgalicoccus halotolerans TaxID=157227 RepID=A0A3E0AVK1_9STAP|nr:hypothetical protein [Jeotgalicoccus halotolerans]REG23790.1 hypothetical protein DFR63_1537 [Jeotgalicoccus halotolerans]
MNKLIDDVHVKYLGMSTEIFDFIKREAIEKYYEMSKFDVIVVLYEMNDDAGIEDLHVIIDGVEISITGHNFDGTDDLQTYIATHFEALRKMAILN